jgi:hypothetical protein
MKKEKSISQQYADQYHAVLENFQKTQHEAHLRSFILYWGLDRVTQ